MRYRVVTFLVFAAAVIALGEWDAMVDRFEFTRKVNDWWLEFNVANAPQHISKPAVTLVGIDEDYRPTIGDSLTRLDYAAILGFVGKFEPKTVAFVPTLEFDETNLLNQTALEPLKEAALRMPEMTLGCVLESGHPPENPEENVTYPALTGVEGDPSAVTAFSRTVRDPEPQMLANGKAAFTEIELADTSSESGDLLLPLIARHGDRIVPSFILHAVARHAGVPLDQIQVRLPGSGGKSVIRVGDAYEIPIDAAGRMKIYRHSGVRPPLYRKVSAFHLTLTGDGDDNLKDLLGDLTETFDSLRNDLVVIGNDSESDRHYAVESGGPILSRAELLTRAIATIQSARYIEWWPQWARLAAAVLIVFFALVTFRVSRRRLFVNTLLGAFLFFGGSVVLFQSTHSWCPPSVALGLFGLMMVCGIILPAPKKQAPASRKGPESEAGKAAQES